MIRVYADPEALSRAAAELFAAEAQKAVRAHGRFAVALAGGSTPRRTYEILREEPYRGQVPWQKLHVFWGDERCVPADDPRNNALMARRALLDHVPVPSAQLHPMLCVRSPHEAAAQYEALLRSFFTGPPRFDLVLLGLGENGHTASLFPGASVLEERRRWVAEVHVAEEGPDRLTLTAAAINQSAQVVFLVSGHEKAAVLREVLEGDREPRILPARLIAPSDGGLLWLVDREAASLLPGGNE